MNISLDIIKELDEMKCDFKQGLLTVKPEVEEASLELNQVESGDY